MAVPDSVIGSGLPIPGVYKEKQLAAEKAYQDALAGLSQQQSQLDLGYGFQSTTDDKGQSSFQLDPAQRHGMAQNLLRNHADSLQSLREGLTGRGLGRRGLAAQRTNLMRFMQGGEVSQLGNSFANQLSSIYNQRGQALNNKNTAFNNAESEAVQFAIANGLFTPPPPPPPPPPQTPFVDPATVTAQYGPNAVNMGNDIVPPHATPQSTPPGGTIGSNAGMYMTPQSMGGTRQQDLAAALITNKNKAKRDPYYYDGGI